MNEGNDARRYLRRHRHGVLSTISKKLDGYPFGSVVRYVTDDAARPVIYISRLAEHTKNIAADPRVSLLVRGPETDPQGGARLTLIGNAVRVSGDLALLQARYVACIPDAERLVALGDFSFYRIEPVTLRYIGGFGAIHWVSARSYAPPANSLHEHQADLVTPMNAEHTTALHDYCRHFKQRQPAAVSFIAIDCDGFDVRADDELLRFDFHPPLVDAKSALAELNAMAGQARR